MSESTTLTIRTKSHLKKEAKEFLDGIGLSLSAWVNLFLNDLVYNQRLSFKLEPLNLVEVDSENLPSDVKQSLEDIEQMDESEFVYFSAESDED